MIRTLLNESGSGPLAILVPRADQFHYRSQLRISALAVNFNPNVLHYGPIDSDAQGVGENGRAMASAAPLDVERFHIHSPRKRPITPGLTPAA